MNRLFCLVLLFLTACCPVSHPRATYRIPPDKQVEAAKLTAAIVESLKNTPHSPDAITDAAYQQTLAIYGEPVKP